MLCRDDDVRVRDVNVDVDVLCVRIFGKFQQLGVNETIGENFMFSGIFHDFETVLVHKSLNVTSSNCFTSSNTWSDVGPLVRTLVFPISKSRLSSSLKTVVRTDIVTSQKTINSGESPAFSS